MKRLCNAHCPMPSKVRLLRPMNAPRSLIARLPLPLQFVFLLIVMLSFSSVFTMLSMALIKPLFGVLGADTLLLEASNQPENLKGDFNKINALKLIQLFTGIGTFMFPAFIFSFIKNPMGDLLQVKRGAYYVHYILAITCIIVSAPMISMVYEWNSAIPFPESIHDYVHDAEEKAAGLTRLFLYMPSVQDLFINLIVIGIVPAIAEELLFRGVIQNMLFERIRNVHIAVWLAAAIFSLVHFQFLGFVPRMFLGAILGYSFYLSGSIWVPIAAHAFNNASQVVLSYLYQQGLISYNIDNNDPMPLWLGFLSVLITVLIIVWMLRRFDKKPPANNIPEADTL